MNDELTCPTREQIEVMALGARDDHELEAHVASCPRCSELMSSIIADNDLLAEVVQVHKAQPTSVEPDDAGESFGSIPDGYDVDSEIHRGSQGVVYLARQRATKRDVALKLTFAGTFVSTKARVRFEREAELVASLQHPNIVTVFDSGLTGDGRHYLAMEYVEGTPLASEVTRGSDRAVSIAPAALRRTIDRFIKICDAVANAHRRGIIHRDLKPANILVDRVGEPHVLDFGLAKVVDAESMSESVVATQAGEFLGTFAYASPEQVAADPEHMDTRSDEYALGVILYELLTGERPYELKGSIRNVIQVIAEAEPRPLLEVNPTVDRDLETIVARMLAKDPDRRYQSVQAVVEDLRHWQCGEPIVARRDDRWYVLRKTIRQYRVPLSVIALFIVMMIAFSIVTFQNVRSRLSEADKAKRILLVLMDTLAGFDLEDPEAAVPAESVIEMLDRMAAEIEEEIEGTPSLEAPVRLYLGKAYLGYRLFDRAEPQLALALALYEELHDEDHADVATAKHQYGRYLWAIAEYDEAEATYRDALGSWRRLYDGDHDDTASTLQHLASSLREAGRLHEAMVVFDDALAMRRRLHPGDSGRVALSLHVIGNGLRDLGRYEEAMAQYTAAVAMLREVIGEANWREGRTQHNVATCLIALERFEEAQATLDYSTAIKKGRPDLASLGRANVLSAQAMIHFGQGSLDEAETLCREAGDLRDAGYGPYDRRHPERNHPDQADSLVLLGRILTAQRRFAEAGVAFEAGRSIRAARLGPDNWETAEARVAIAEWHAAQDAVDAARLAFDQAQRGLSILAESASARQRWRAVSESLLIER